MLQSLRQGRVGAEFRGEEQQDLFFGQAPSRLLFVEPGRVRRGTFHPGKVQFGVFLHRHLRRLVLLGLLGRHEEFLGILFLYAWGTHGPKLRTPAYFKRIRAIIAF